MDSIKKYFKLYRSYLSLALKSSLAYRGDAIIGIFGFIISNVANFFVLYLMIAPVSQIVVVFQGIELVWDINRLMFLYGVLLIPKGIDHMLSDNLWYLAGSYVRNGDLDRNLVKPVNVLFQIVSSKFEITGLGEIILGTCFIGIFASKINPTVAVTINTVLPLILSCLLTTFIFFYIKLFFSSLAFWVKNSMAITSTFYNLNDFGRYPVQIYGKVVSSILIFVIPFSLGAYLPVQFFIFGGNMWILFFVILGITTIGLLIALFTFFYGLHKYESAGS